VKTQMFPESVTKRVNLPPDVTEHFNEVRPHRLPLWPGEVRSDLCSRLQIWPSLRHRLTPGVRRPSSHSKRKRLSFPATRASRIASFSRFRREEVRSSSLAPAGLGHAAFRTGGDVPAGLRPCPCAGFWTIGWHVAEELFTLDPDLFFLFLRAIRVEPK